MNLNSSRIVAVLTTFILSCFAGTASAQDGEVDPLAAEAMLLEKEAQKPKLDHSSDPDPKSLAKVKEMEKSIEERLNTLQSGAETFLDIVEGVNAATNTFMTAQRSSLEPMTLRWTSTDVPRRKATQRPPRKPPKRSRNCARST